MLPAARDKGAETSSSSQRGRKGNSCLVLFTSLFVLSPHSSFVPMDVECFDVVFDVFAVGGS